MEAAEAHGGAAPADAQGAVTTSDPPRPLRTLAWVVVAALVAVTLGNLAALWADLIQLDLATDTRDLERVPFRELDESDDRVRITAIFQTGTYVVCIVAFLVWYARAYRNIERLGARDLRWGKGWAIGYWFIPIMNLFRPKQVVNDTWRASDPDLPLGAQGWQGNDVPVLLHIWWGVWILSSFVNNRLFNETLDSTDTPEEFVSLATTYVVWDLVDIIPALLAAFVVRSLTSRQEERRRRFERGELAAAEHELVPVAPPGWYPDPDDPGRQRFWAGGAWTEQRR